MRPQKHKVDMSGGETLASANPFESLNLGPLPDAAPKPVVAEKKATGKKPLGQGRRIELKRVKSGRGGKTVVEVSGLAVLPAAERERIAHALKKRCACGGTYKNGILEIQGDAREIIEEMLQGEGFRTVRSGG